ncbi:enoyl-CoA hydratase/isomerase family protein [Nocardioides humi]|uniref:Enoyl-CoA hydratase-related protein n=1 Tax=Nocardioides humi TaxID=449461 RepID=A0ABN2AB56_9ACTN|nr:enoyl-CoA hydratase/isomerase family protein [Nocardioides humi]
MTQTASTWAPPTLADLDLEFVKTEVRDGVGYLKLDRPPVNAHNTQMILELDQAFTAVRFDDEVRAVVLTSETERFFSAGADIAVIRDEKPHRTGLLSQTSKEVILKARSIPKVFIAAINGHCMGGGLELAFACDLRFACDGPYKYGMPELVLGVMPGEGGSQLLGRAIGPNKALKLMLDNTALSVAEALELGLVDVVLEAETFRDDVHAYAKRIADGPILAIGATKVALTEGIEMSLPAGFSLERMQQNDLLRSADAAEGAEAYLSKRDPKWSSQW